MCRGAQAEPPAHADPDILPQETLRKYITYAKHHCRPKLQNADYDKIAAARARAPGAAGARSASCGLSGAGVACLAWYAHLHPKSASPQKGRTYKPLLQKGPSACVHAARAYGPTIHASTTHQRNSRPHRKQGTWHRTRLRPAAAGGPGAARAAELRA